MTLNDILRYSLVIVALLLIGSVLLQNRSGGLGTVFGGMSGGEFYRSKRGLEAILYNSTVILGIIFCIICIAIAVVNA